MEGVPGPCNTVSGRCEVHVRTATSTTRSDSTSDSDRSIGTSPKTRHPGPTEETDDGRTVAGSRRATTTRGQGDKGLGNFCSAVYRTTQIQRGFGKPCEQKGPVSDTPPFSVFVRSLHYRWTRFLSWDGPVRRILTTTEVTTGSSVS